VPAGGQQSDRGRIAELELVWNEAHLVGDIDALDRLWSPTLTVVVPGMPLLRKPDLLAMWRSMKVTFTEYTTSELEIQVYGSAAVVTGRLHRSRDFGGRTATETWLFTKSYVREEGDWRVAAYHASDAPTK
jgi:ketosteroid isomerase-like protein